MRPGREGTAAACRGHVPLRWIPHGIVIFTADSGVWQTITPPALKATIHEAVTAPRAEGDKQAGVGTAGDLDQGVDAIEQLRQSQTLIAALPPGSPEVREMQSAVQAFLQPSLRPDPSTLNTKPGRTCIGHSKPNVTRWFRHPNARMAPAPPPRRMWSTKLLSPSTTRAVR